ncbi:D-alanyl-D-alanine carboxypeptidase-like protein [Micromonospora pisi]|uniref:D-alanyl-D-alanine carboxypeptidase-like protein n=1 Tax=Micromonospora pisi TaxID=589240 RepID=A0A495JTW4_9ACTN|nr:M15 family metallopeptidase [Micromonospora pisi]RKR91988.1 D-alanyl-D-alanine carboxypeptidase-like protein [Micromonospora pisi]
MRRNRHKLILGVLLPALVTAACAAPPASPAPGVTAPTPPPAPAATSTGPPPEFVASVAPVTGADVAQSWRPGCPVGPNQLDLLTLSYWGFDAQPHTGTIVVNRTVAKDVVTVFRSLYDQRFPIRRMTPVDAYGGDDDRSMADDNTSGFNCRAAVATGPTKWSAHAYGQAIDINPVENPYLVDGAVLPPAGAAYADRDRDHPGLAVPDGPLVRAFAAVGWSWGGDFRAPDYQHFSSTGG